MRVIVVTSDNATWKNVSRSLRGIGIHSSRCSTVEDCRHILRRDSVDLVFCDERVSDGDYWDVFSAITQGLIKGPRIVLMSRTMTASECEQAKCCGMFAVIEAPCPSEAVEWTLALAQRAQRLAPKGDPSGTAPRFDIFAGTPDHNPVWICAIGGLANAKERMDEIAVESPGRYFIFNPSDRTVLAQTETFAQPVNLPKVQGESA
jgi:DNA-binding NtrC family response regulator